MDETTLFSKKCNLESTLPLFYFLLWLLKVSNSTDTTIGFHHLTIGLWANPATYSGCPPGVTIVNCFVDPCTVSVFDLHIPMYVYVLNYL